MPQGVYSEGPLLLFHISAVREQGHRTQSTLLPGLTYSGILFTCIPDGELFPYQQDAVALAWPARV